MKDLDTLSGDPLKYKIYDLIEEEGSGTIIQVIGYDTGVLKNIVLGYTIKIVIAGSNARHTYDKSKYAIAQAHLENEKYFKLAKHQTLEVLYGRQEN